MHKAGKTEGAIYELIREYKFLVAQPLAGISEELLHLKSVQFGTLSEQNQCEDIVLLTHTIELVWFRSVHSDEWESLLKKWLERCPSWFRKPLRDLERRLRLQTQLTAPGPKFPLLSQGTASDLPPDLRFAQLWLHLFHSDGKALDATIESFNAVTEPDSHVARLLFDFHHANRFQGRFPYVLILYFRCIVQTADKLPAHSHTSPFRNPIS